MPVIVDARETVNTRDRRGRYEGRLWSSEMPISAFVDGPLSLVFPDGDMRAIRFSDQHPTKTNLSSNPGLWDFFEAFFIAEDNVGKS